MPDTGKNPFPFAEAFCLSHQLESRQAGTHLCYLCVISVGGYNTTNGRRVIYSLGHFVPAAVFKKALQRKDDLISRLVVGFAFLGIGYLKEGWALLLFLLLKYLGIPLWHYLVSSSFTGRFVEFW